MNFLTFTAFALGACSLAAGAGALAGWVSLRICPPDGGDDDAE
ncbi:hypothetical protein [Halorarius halobius]|nr:hypothetical protein [Halorarius halobius]